VGGTEGSTSGRLRDVPTPQETEPGSEGPAVWIYWGALQALGGNAYCKPGRIYIIWDVRLVTVCKIIIQSPTNIGSE